MWNYLKNVQSTNVTSPLSFEWSDSVAFSDSFETASWSKLTISTTHVKNGTYSGLW